MATLHKNTSANSAVHDITQLFASARSSSAGQQALFDRLYPEIKAMAKSRVRRSGNLNTLDTTALTHESYLKLIEGGQLSPNSRGEFFAYVGRVMRSIVVDYARAQGTAKRGGGVDCVTLDTLIADSALAEVPLEALDSALDALKAMDERLYHIVEMRFFAGLTMDEIAVTLAVSERTIKRDWQKARVLLQGLLSPT
jgi:RNA polymerase sigma factor (TIGR02999 family)